MDSKLSTVERKRKNWFQRIILIICLAVFLFSLVKIGKIYLEYADNESVLREIQDTYYGNIEQSDFQHKLKYERLFAINPDIVGWISMDGTKIDYPVLQSTDNEFYLNHNYKKEHSKAGSIFMDYRNQTGSLDRHTIIYGHQMKDDSMFGQLESFLEKDFFMKNKHFQFETIEEGFGVEIFSVYVTTTDFNYIETEFISDEDYITFVNTIQGKSEIKTNVTVENEDKILTLSTCNKLIDEKDGRLVLHGKITRND